METKQVNVRVPDSGKDMILELARRMRDDESTADRLRTFLSEPAADTLTARVGRLEVTVADVLRRLEGSPPSREVMPHRTIPAALTAFYEKLRAAPDCDPAIRDVPIDSLVAEDVLQFIQGTDLGSPPPDELHPLFGGGEYIQAVEKWGRERAQWARSRKQDKGSPPKPPSIPCR